MARTPAAPYRHLLLIALLLPFGGLGCNLLATTLWIIHPNDMAAEYDGLKGKRVAVVCRATTALDINNIDAADLIARQVSVLLRKNVKRIQMIAQKEVNDWMDVNGAKSYEALGEALHADRVVVIELAKFGVRDGRTLYQGRARAKLMVYDVESGESTDLAPLESVYPPHNGVPTDISEDQFRANFVNILSGQIARRFHPYEARAIDDHFYRE